MTTKNKNGDSAKIEGTRKLTPFQKAKAWDMLKDMAAPDLWQTLMFLEDEVVE